MNEELDIDMISAEIDTIYGALGNIEAEISGLEDDFDDDWDDEWSAIVPEEEDDMAEDIDEETLDESVRRKRVVRGGRRVVKYKSNKPGYRVKMVNGRPREVRMKPQERRKRRKGQRRGVRKRRSKRAASARKRKLSNRKRSSSMKRMSRKGR
jgi:hypothetical protein